MKASHLLLDRFEVDAGPVLHSSPTAIVFAVTDLAKPDLKPLPRLALKAVRDEDVLLAELKNRVGIDNGTVVPISTVYLDGAVDVLAYEGKVPMVRVPNLSAILAPVLRKRRGGRAAEDAAAREADGGADDECEGYRFLIEQKLADRTLSTTLVHDRIGGRDFVQVRFGRLSGDSALDTLRVLSGGPRPHVPSSSACRECCPPADGRG